MKNVLLKKIVSIVSKCTSIPKNQINIKGKTKIVKGKKSRKPDFKKAIITLKKGQSIDLSTGI